MICNRQSAIGVAIALSSIASPALAVTYTFDFSGTIAAQTSPGSDPHISVGDTIRVQARVDDSRVTEWGSFGYKVAFLYGLPTDGEQYFRVTLNGLTWNSFHEILDGEPFWEEFFYEYFPDGSNSGQHRTGGAPAIAFGQSDVLGIAGQLLSVGGSPGQVPSLGLGSSPGAGFSDVQIDESGLNGGSYEYKSYSPFILSTQFSIEDTFEYNNEYRTPGFTGSWNFVGGVAVPEPGIWLLTIGGFGAIGCALRRKRAAFVSV